MELNLDVENDGFAAICENELTKIMQTKCDRVTIEQYQRNATWWKRFLHWLSYDIARVILFFFTMNMKYKD